MLRLPDKLLNNLTMYAVAYYGLLGLLTVAVALGFLGLVPYGGWSILASSLVLLTVCRVANLGLAWLFGATTNFESPAITALILTFVLQPAVQWTDAVTLGLVAVVAMASKYLLAIRARHIFNPAAMGLVVIGLLGGGAVTWWVATPAMLPAVAVLGFLVVRKLQRGLMVAVTIAAALAAISLSAAVQDLWTADILIQAFLSWPLVFFATIMVTEPSTQPATRGWRLVYGAVVGGLFGGQLTFGSLATTPEMALVLGNLLAFVAAGTGRLRMQLVTSHELVPGVYEFVFKPNGLRRFKAGQYMEWTLVHRNPDLRGSRRYFTVASSPTESEVRLATRVGPGRVSSFKTALQKLQPGHNVSATGPMGDFVLPNDAAAKLVWLAGGIGVTPFRSQAKYLTDTKQRRDVSLLYLASNPQAFVYRAEFDRASAVGVVSHYILSGDDASKWNGPCGPLTIELLTKLVPDFTERTYYLSGPSGLISQQRGMLRAVGIPSSRIHTDDFPGY